MKNLLFFILTICVAFSFGCVKKETTVRDTELSVLVFIPGVIAGSPPYELMAEGAREFANNNQNVNVKIYEAGMNQAEWEQQLAQMISGGEYEIVLSSNPSLPEICANIAGRFPNQKFIITDAHYEGHPQIRTYLFNQYEQSFFLGVLAGLITTSSMPNVTKEKRIGFIAAQEFPLLTREMIPGFLDGARSVDPEIVLDRRIIGSWADAAKAAELASAMLDTGVDALTAIAGGASQGVIKTAADRGAYIVWYNTNAYSQAPGVIVGCGIMEQKKLVMEILEQALAGEIQYGISETIGVKEGYLRFEFDDPGYKNTLPASLREKFEKMYVGITEYQ
ncbi:MAG: BMP family ABC transporter substrate-binding protein [Treponema sp.]|jgi:simple sugar transport system substrate-binding protein|nr:BMP family ABC transporter substrate-binding protein [Treponema sp.]